MVEDSDASILAAIGGVIAFIFTPLGFGNWQATVASITGLVAKENIGGTLGILYGGGASTYATMHAAFTQAAGMSFLCFNLLCAPCFAAIGSIKREMNNHKWTWFAIGYQCLFAYIIGFIVYNIGTIVGGAMSPAGIIGLVISILIIVFGLYPLFRKNKNAAGYTAKA